MRTRRAAPPLGGNWRGIPALLGVIFCATAMSPAGEVRSPAAGVATEERPAFPRAGVPFEEVEVRLVMLRASVLGPHGKAVTGLGPGDFELTDSGVPQTIQVFGTAADRPLSIAFLLDVSGSMGVRGKLDLARGAIRSLTRRLRPADRVGLLIFADGAVRVEAPLSTDRETFEAALSRQRAYGKTALRDAVVAAPELLAGTGNSRRALFLVTDGVDNASSVSTFEALRAARQVAVPIHVLGLSDLPAALRGGSHRGKGRTVVEVLEAVAEETGGILFTAFSDDELDRAVVEVEGHLRSQYVIGYHPSAGGEPGEYRPIVLSAGGPDRRVVTRRGYRIGR
ncbi:MAG: VWA domain-containing protein [Acidobacteriota bacterium]